MTYIIKIHENGRLEAYQEGASVSLAQVNACLDIVKQKVVEAMNQPQGILPQGVRNIPFNPKQLP